MRDELETTAGTISELANDHMRLRNAYLMAENRILRSQINDQVQITDSKHRELAEISAKLGKKTLAEIWTYLVTERSCASQAGKTVLEQTQSRLRSVLCDRIDRKTRAK